MAWSKVGWSGVGVRRCGGVGWAGEWWGVVVLVGWEACLGWGGVGRHDWCGFGRRGGVRRGGVRLGAMERGGTGRRGCLVRRFLELVIGEGGSGVAAVQHAHFETSTTTHTQERDENRLWG